MTIAHFIHTKIRDYPSLFKDIDYPKSKMKVLENTFGSSEYDFAHVKEGRQGGYLVTPYYTKRGYERRIDPPYSTRKVGFLPAEYFDMPVFEVRNLFLKAHVREGFSGYNVIYEPPAGISKEEYLERLKQFPSLMTLQEVNDTRPFHTKLNDKPILRKLLNGEGFLQQDWLNEVLVYAYRCLIFLETEEYKQGEESYYKAVTRNRIEHEYAYERGRKARISTCRALVGKFGVGFIDAPHPQAQEVRDMIAEFGYNPF